MGTSALIAVLASAGTFGQTIQANELRAQQEVFQRLWGSEFILKYDDLPKQAQVADFRVPYSGAIYPDTAGGCVNVLRKYDQAFHDGRYPATAYERWDTTAARRWQTVRRRYRTARGRYYYRTTRVFSSPYWHGHCNGWTAAAIRHAEPQQSVTRNGVVFTPADIKGLLAEIYIYNDSQLCVGHDYRLNAGMFHAFLANWLGRGSHPVAMESDPGREKWNYPIYAYTSTFHKHSDRRVEVKLNVAYSMYVKKEVDKSEHVKKTKYFHYLLYLDEAGDITGGYFYRDSSYIDFLWLPLRPKPSRQEGNLRGNPHVDVDEVLAIWRDSVPAEVRHKWRVIDPATADRLPNVAALAGLVPRQELPVAAPAE